MLSLSWLNYAAVHILDVVDIVSLFNGLTVCTAEQYDNIYRYPDHIVSQYAFLIYRGRYQYVNTNRNCRFD